jgi:hypothetical protein
MQGLNRISHDRMPIIIHSSIHDILSIEPATHIYLAWQGWHPEDKKAMGRLFALSRTACVVTVVQNYKGVNSSSSLVPISIQLANYMAELGFGEVQMIGVAMTVSLAGSGKHLQAYTFQRSQFVAPKAFVQSQGLYLLPQVSYKACMGSKGVRSRGQTHL